MEIIGFPDFCGGVYAEGRPKLGKNRFGGRSQGEMSCLGTLACCPSVGSLP